MIWNKISLYFLLETFFSFCPFWLLLSCLSSREWQQQACALKPVQMIEDITSKIRMNNLVEPTTLFDIYSVICGTFGDWERKSNTQWWQWNIICLWRCVYHLRNISNLETSPQCCCRLPRQIMKASANLFAQLDQMEKLHYGQRTKLQGIRFILDSRSGFFTMRLLPAVSPLLIWVKSLRPPHPMSPSLLESNPQNPRIFCKGKNRRWWPRLFLSNMGLNHGRYSVKAGLNS